MAEFPALPLWTDALLGDTYQLTPAEFGAYLRLLIVAWRRPDCDLPNDDAFLGRSVGDPRGWHRLKHKVLSYFTMGSDGLLRQKRLTDERKYLVLRATRSAAGGRAKALKGRHQTSAKPLLNECQMSAPTPTPIKKESKKVVVRATRWHPDCVITSEWMGDAQVARLRNGLPEIDVMLEAEKFCNFWISKSGAGATKLDWHKTWINWILKAEAPRHGNGKSTAHDKFIRAGLSLIHDADRQARGDIRGGEDDTADNGADGPRGPFLPS